MGGADLVLELPTVWAASTAQSFARGAVALLEVCGAVEHISFGSECGDIGPLDTLARCLCSEAYEQRVAELAAGGDTFAVCRQQAVAELLDGETAALLATPNNNLGVEYLCALRRLGSAIQPMTVLRRGAGHNTVGQTAPFVSATQIRGELARDNWAGAEPYLPQGGRAVLEGHTVAAGGMAQVERAVLARLRAMTGADWAQLPDSGAAEGLPQRLERAGRSCRSVEEFFDLAKTKRYTRARLARLLLWAWLGIAASDVPAAPPYIRVLGFNGRGRELLHQMRNRATLPILTKPAHARQLEEAGRRLFELESRCTDLYDLCCDPVPVPGRDWNTDPVILL
jgi:predicted nucleotidyltransferase